MERRVKEVIEVSFFNCDNTYTVNTVEALLQISV